MTDTVKIESVPASTLGYEDLDKLAHRYGVSASALGRMHVLFLDDTPNEDTADEGVRRSKERVITTAVLLTKPVSLQVASVGSAIKSPDDTYDVSRGEAITFARAVRALGK